MTIPFKTLLYSFLALVAFAGNSILCRLALKDEAIDPASFTILRLVSGMLMLICMILMTQPRVLTMKSVAGSSWTGACMLFIYAICFSYAYVTLDTGIGALVLFGSVQITMILANYWMGGRLHYIEWFGLIIAFSGFIYLIYPELSTPSLSGFIIMALSGIGWAGYTLVGRGSKKPTIDTTINFIKTLPFVLVFICVMYFVSDITLTDKGIYLAIASGALASALGYPIWYLALPHLTPTQAAVIQIFVPILAILAGIIFAGELLTLRLCMASLAVLGGIGLVIYGKALFHKNR